MHRPSELYIKKIPTPGKKDGGRKCSTCKYRDNISGQGNCNYLSIMHHSRGCPATACSKYEKGNPKKIVKTLSI